MTFATNLTLAATLTLAAKFHEGRTALDAGRPAEAVAALTAVVEADPGLPELALAARILRARAHAAAKNVPAARADYLWLGSRPVPADLRALARKEYIAAGGDASDFAPKLSPVAEWQRLQELIENENAEEIEAALTDEFQNWVRSFRRILGGDDGPDLYTFLSQEELVLEDQATDEAAGVARLVFRREGVRYVVHWAQEGPRWLISGIEMRTGNPEGEVGSAEADPFGPAGRRTEGDKREPPAAPMAAEPAAEIEECIRRLGDADAAVRARARARLQTIGAVARPMLRARINDPDPEIAVTVRELLEDR